MLLLILAVVWAVVLVPPWLRSRADARPADSIGAFRHRLTVLERTGPVGTRRVPMLSHRPETHGFVPSLRILWVVHLLVDAMFVTYVSLLVHMRNQAAERDMKVRFLPGRLPGRAPEPALLLRRSAH